MDLKNIDIIPPSQKKPEIESDSQRKEIPETPKQLNEQPKKKKKFKVLIPVFFVFVLLLVGSYFFLKKEISTPLNLADRTQKIFEIKEGDSVNQIAKALKEKGLIKNEFYFIFYVYKSGLISELKAGRYSFSSSMSIVEIVQKIARGEVIKDEVKITIPEGFRLSQIEARINKEFKPDKNSEIKLSDFKIKDFKDDFDFLMDVPDEASLEGYLFPDTYYFKNSQDMTSKEKRRAIVEKMLSNFGNKVNVNLQEEIKNQNKTIFEIVTMASILEKEVKTKEDREIVSGIFWKRIKEGKPIESCATIAYILGEDKWRYSYEDTRIESPYNTYLNKGLPKGPISNPGIEAIQAAIYPTDTEYNFFLTDPATGNTIFSKTLEEHNQNKVKYFNR